MSINPVILSAISVLEILRNPEMLQLLLTLLLNLCYNLPNFDVPTKALYYHTGLCVELSIYMSMGSISDVSETAAISVSWHCVSALAGRCTYSNLE